MKAVDALHRLSRHMPIDNEAWTDEDRDYLRTILRALSEMADREAREEERDG